MVKAKIPLVLSAWLWTFACTLDNEPKSVRPLPHSAIASFSFHQEPECGFPKRTVDSLTRDTLFYTEDDYYASKTVLRKKVPESLILKMQNLFDSLRIDSLSRLNVIADPCGPQTADCKSHNILRVHRDSLSEYSDTRRCMVYDAAFSKAFAAFRIAMYALRKE
jgi:hypothetical protein